MRSVIIFALAIASSISGCREPSDPVLREVVDTDELVEPIVGYWMPDNNTGADIFLEDGKYHSVHRFDDGTWDISEGAWAKIDGLKIYTFMVEDTLFAGKWYPTTVWRESLPKEPGARIVDGAVYEFVSKDQPLGSDQNTRFAYSAETDSITISHGCYSSVMTRFNRDEETAKSNKAQMGKPRKTDD